MSDRQEVLAGLGGADPLNDPIRMINDMCKQPPKAPFGWRPPGPYPLTIEMESEPMFKLLARAAWKAGRGYLVEHLWAIWDYTVNIEVPYRAELDRRRKERIAQQWADGERVPEVMVP